MSARKCAWILSLVVLPIGLAATASAIPISYDANPGPAPDPTTVGWTAAVGDNGPASGTAIIDNGLPGWQAWDGDTNSWQKNATHDDAVLAHTYGWSMSTKMEITNVSYTGNYSQKLIFWDMDGPQTQWQLQIRPRANGLDTVVKLNNDSVNEYVVTGGINNFHTYGLVYNTSGPDAGYGDLYIDGANTGLKNNAPFDGSTWGMPAVSYVQFGDCTGGNGNGTGVYNTVAWSATVPTPEPATLVLLATGLLGLLAYAWRKRR